MAELFRNKIAESFYKDLQLQNEEKDSLKPGDRVVDSNSNYYNVERVSLEYEKLQKYDLNGAASEIFNAFGNDGIQWVVVSPIKNPSKTYVFKYGPDGVVKIWNKQEVVKPVLAETKAIFEGYKKFLVESAKIDVKAGDTVEDYGGNKYKVLKVAKKFNDVKAYDSTGMGKEWFDEVGDTELWIAVKDQSGKNTLVYTYGDDGVKKI